MPPRARSAARRSRRTIKWVRVLAVGGIAVVAALVGATAATLVGGHRAQASPEIHLRTAAQRPSRSVPAERAAGAASARYVSRAGRNCQAPRAPHGYVNPLARASLIRERIDQGVDYAGTGTLAAIGAAEITFAATTGTGWPGAFLEYRLLDGPDAGCYVYYAEGINPAHGLHAGQSVHPGQTLAAIVPGWSTGIELGWGAGQNTKTLAQQTGKWTARDDANSVASEAGKSFSALIARLGGPPGRVEG